MLNNKKHNKNSLVYKVKVYTFKDRILSIRDFIVRRSGIIFPVIIIIAALTTIIISLFFKKDVIGDSYPIAEHSDPVQEVIMDIEENVLELNVNDKVIQLVVDYFQAMVVGDVDVVANFHDQVIKDTTKIRIQELSKYIESYPAIEVYSKRGPIENSIMAYVYYKVDFIGYEVDVPGMQFFYLKQKDNGEYIICNEAPLEEAELDFIADVESQEDIIELKNKITVENDEILLDESNGIFAFMAQLTQEVDIKVGQLLAEGLQPEQSEEDIASADTLVESEGDEAVAVENEEVFLPLNAKTTSTINVRSSDSLTADLLGKLSLGESIVVYDKQANGWCKIQYEGRDAYIKTDYVYFEEAVTDAQVIGSITPNTTVNVRAEAEQTSQRIGGAVEGESYDLLEELDGWFKINYEVKVGYISAEYATKN